MTRDVIFAACDSKYFVEHAASFIASASLAGFSVHIHVTNPTAHVESLAGHLSGATYSYDREDHSGLTSEQLRAHYTCIRFHQLPGLLEEFNSAMVFDIDCLIMKPFSFPKEPCAYFERADLDFIGWKSLASGFYFHHTAKSVCQAISDEIKRLPLEWYVDQIAMHNVMHTLDHTYAKRLDSSFIDAEFSDEAPVWNGKGPRKKENQKYLAAKAAFEAEVFPLDVSAKF